MNKILVYCGIADINQDHDEGKKESLKIRFIPNQSYGIISMEDNFIVAEQSKYTDQSKGVCAKGGGGLSTNKYKKGTKGGASFSTVGSN